MASLAIYRSKHRQQLGNVLDLGVSRSMPVHRRDNSSEEVADN